jgi:hypothetical protein
MRKLQDKAKAREYLLEVLKPGDTVYTSLRHVSRSGMYRVVRLFVIRDNKPIDITWNVASLCEGYDDRHEGAKVSGCGTDVGFELVYNTSAHLWPAGFTCIGDGCPSNDHSNGDRDYSPHAHRDGGYALVRRWL